MNDITKLMIEMYKLEQLGYDFLGYEKEGNGEYSFHHLLIPRRHNGPVSIENGAIIRRVPHDYLHQVEFYDLELFNAITSEMVDMNLKGHLDMINIANIDTLLCYFEREYSGKTTKKGHPIVKEQYTRRLIRK